MADENANVSNEDAHLLANHNFYRLGEFFEINNHADRVANQKALEEVLNWAKKESSSEDLVDVLLHIRSVERQLGTNYKIPIIAA